MQRGFSLMNKVYGHPGSDPHLAALLEQAYAAGSDIDRVRYRAAERERNREFRSVGGLVAQLISAGAPEGKVALAQAGSDARVSVLGDDLRRFAPPDAASVERLREKHRALQARAAEGPEETAPCIVYSRFSEKVQDIRHSALRVEVERTRSFGGLLEMSEFLDRQDQNQFFVVRGPNRDEGAGFHSAVMRKEQLAKLMEELQLSQIWDGLSLTPCTPVIVDHITIEGLKDMWATIARVGGLELLDRCPDLCRPDQLFKEGQHLLNAVVDKTPKGEIMRGFASEAPDLESLIGPAVSAAQARVNGPANDGARETRLSALLDLVTVGDPFRRPEPERDAPAV
jgi:hypothetical protein